MALIETINILNTELLENNKGMEWIFEKVKNLGTDNPKEFYKRLKDEDVFEPFMGFWNSWWDSEKRMEYEWSYKISSDKSKLTDFSDYDTYVEMISEEIKLLERHINLNGKKMLFIGSGPFPISPILFSEISPGLKVACMDSDNESIKQGNILLSKFNYSFETHNALLGSLDITKKPPLEQYDIIFTAGMVGKSNEEKNKYLESARELMKKDSIFAIRSFCIPFYADTDSQKSWEILGEHSINNQKVKSNISILKPKHN